MNKKGEMLNISNRHLSQIHHMSGSPVIQKCQTFEKKEEPRIPPKAGLLGKKLKNKVIADEIPRKRVEGKRRGGWHRTKGKKSNNMTIRVPLF